MEGRWARVTPVELTRSILHPVVLAEEGARLCIPLI